jgi:hypothetical protein
MFMLFGGLMNGPAMHYSISQGSCPRSFAKRILITQAFFSAVSISSFYVFTRHVDDKHV